MSFFGDDPDLWPDIDETTSEDPPAEVPAPGTPVVKKPRVKKETQDPPQTRSGGRGTQHSEEGAAELDC